MVQRLPAALAVAAVLAATAAAALPLPWGLGGRHRPSPPPTMTPGAAAADSSPSDVPTDPSVRLGVLANGLRYAILPIPGSPVSVHLRLAAGALDEAADQTGFAAMLRRLAFDGVKLTHGGDPRALAAAHDLRFNADETVEANGISATTYRFDGVKGGEAAIEASLALLRGVAGGLALSGRDIDRERDQLASEARGPGEAQYRLFRLRARFLLEGAGANDALAGVEPPARIKREAIARFYAATYRPERAVLVVVGDVDPARIEAQVRARFGDWRPKGAAGARPAIIAPPAGPRERLVIDPAAPMTLQVSWLAPAPAAGDTLARRKEALVETVAIAVLNHRLADLGGGDDDALGGAALLRDDALGVPLTALLAGSDADHWRATLASLDQEERRARDQAATPAEIAEAITSVRAGVRARVDLGPPSPIDASEALAAGLASNTAPTSAAQDLAFFDANAGLATPETVANADRALFSGAGPFIFVTSPQPIAGGEAAIAVAYNEARAEPLNISRRGAPLAWPYTDFGPSGVVASQRDVADLGSVLVTFANGVRLIVKPTKFAPGEVRVKVLAGSGLPPTLDGAAIIRAGLGKIAGADIPTALGSVRVGADLKVEGGAAAFTGLTRAEDLEAQMQVITAFLVDPARPPPSSTGVTAGPIAAVIVGDVTPEKAIDAVAATLGALPAVAGPPRPPAPAADSPARTLLAETARDGGGAREPSAARLEAARAALLARLDRDQRSNAWWLDALTDVDADPARLAHLRSLRAAFLRATLAEVRAAAGR